VIENLTLLLDFPKIGNFCPKFCVFQFQTKICTPYTLNFRKWKDPPLCGMTPPMQNALERNSQRRLLRAGTVKNHVLRPRVKHSLQLTLFTVVQHSSE